MSLIPTLRRRRRRRRSQRFAALLLYVSPWRLVGCLDACCLSRVQEGYTWKEKLMFAIDASQSMLEPASLSDEARGGHRRLTGCLPGCLGAALISANSGRLQEFKDCTWLEVAVKVVKEVVRARVIQGGGDEAALIFFHTVRAGLGRWAWRQQRLLGGAGRAQQGKSRLGQKHVLCKPAWVPPAAGENQDQRRPGGSGIPWLVRVSGGLPAVCRFLFTRRLSLSLALLFCAHLTSPGACDCRCRSWMSRRPTTSAHCGSWSTTLRVRQGHGLLPSQPAVCRVAVCSVAAAIP